MANRMLILSSELQLNLLEKDNKSQVDGKIVAKRDIKTEKQHRVVMSNSSSSSSSGSVPTLSNVNNINQAVVVAAGPVTTADIEKDSGSRVLAQPRVLSPLPQPQPYKYDFNANAVDVEQLNGGGGGSSGGSTFERQSSLSGASSALASTMELECIAGYDGGLPQHFVLEAYDSRTKRLRLNVTSAYTDIPLFRFDLSGKWCSSCLWH